MSSIDKINELRAKYDTLEVNNPQQQQPGQTPGQTVDPFGNDGLQKSNELTKDQAQQGQQAPKQDDGSGAMWAMFGVNLGMNILNGILGAVGKGGGGGGGGGEDDQQGGGGGGG